MRNLSGLGDVREALREALLAAREGAPHGVIHNQHVIDRLKRDRPQLIEFCKTELINMALTKLYNDECGKKPRTARSIRQPDFFEDAAKLLPPISIGRTKRVDLLQLPINEAIELASSKAKVTKPAKPDRTAEILNELNSCSVTGEERVSELIKEYRKKLSS